MYHLIRKQKGQRASVLIMFGIGLIAIFGFVSLGTDLGIIYKRRAELQQAVDAAAIAGSKKIDEIKNFSIMVGHELVWTSAHSAVTKNAAKESGKKNGITLIDQEVTLIPSNFPEKVYIKKAEDVELFFAKILNIDSVKVVVEAESENQYLSTGVYDVVPWGIPQGQTVQNANVELQSNDHFNGFQVSSLGSIEFTPGREYLLKLGSGIPDSAYDAVHAGDKLLVKMGAGDQPSDAAYKKAYGFAYWCLQNNIPVDWLMNYRGGSFMIDYRGDLFTGDFADVTLSSPNGSGVINGKFGGINYTLVNKTQVPAIYRSAFKTLYMEKDLKIAVYTVQPKWGDHVVPFGIDYRQFLEDGQPYILKFNSEVNQMTEETYYYDETQWVRGDYQISEAMYGIDFNLDGDVEDLVPLPDVTAVPKISGGGIFFDETVEYAKRGVMNEIAYQCDFNHDGDFEDLVLAENVTGISIEIVGNIVKIDLNCDGDFEDQIQLSEESYKLDINDDGDFEDLMEYEHTEEGVVLPGPGNFSALAIDGNGAQVFEASIINGCQTELNIGDIVLTEPGNMAGPTYDGISYRINNGLIYVTCPIVNTLEINGRKNVVIVGFAHFILQGTNLEGVGNNASAEVIGMYVDTENWDVDIEDPNAFVVSRILTEAGVPFSWVHDEEILNGDLANYNILMTDDDRKFLPEVVGKISEFTDAGGFLYAQDGPSEDIDLKIKIYNQLNGTALSQIAFYPANLSMDPAVASVDSNSAGNFILSNDYAQMSDFELMAVQDHSAFINGYTGEVASYNSAAVMAEVKVLGSIDAGNDKYLFAEYGNGHAVLLGGHDQKTTAGWRLILNNIFIATQQPANIAMKPNLGCLDLNGILNALDEQEYYVNLTNGYTGVVTKDVYVYSLPGNIPGLTNSGVSVRFDAGAGASIVLDGGSSNITPSGSPRGVLVPIIVPSPFATEDYFADNQGRTVIYDLKGRSRVKVIGLGLFLLSDVNRNPVSRSELSINPDDPTGKGIYNGQVRGVFVKYIEAPGVQL